MSENLNAPKRRKSGLSDFTPPIGPGPFADTRRIESLLRCRSAVDVLCRQNTTIYQSKNLDIFDENNEVWKIIAWYWWDKDMDDRTTGADLKRELTDVVQHLRPLVDAMQVVSEGTRRTVSRLAVSHKEFLQNPRDIFSEALKLNQMILDQCTMHVKYNYVKQAETAVKEACEPLMYVWNKITGRKFKIRKETSQAAGSGRLVTCEREFNSSCMHFLHVMLQAIDTEISYSNVLTGLKGRKGGQRDQDTIVPRPKR